ncbi:hypothetical protein [Hymenobacter sp. DG25A]|uniref:hypothetical protein n=1 Tax=Hymenobacter sp. DG25A TaxID=1385663 RepID=UPI0006BCF0CE|nr:hypothetical protein [Hymenobacter sp. DG25A]ALD20485.1 hypothetical protein AM218_03695 [Hymenobacter sp. DG25A]
MKAKAYNEHWIFNGLVQQAARHWGKRGLLPVGQEKAIAQAFPDARYSPHLFIKIALFIFTCIGTIGAALFVSLMVGSSLKSGFQEEQVFIACSLLCGLGAFFFLEVLIPANQLYRSGPDNALLYLGLTFIVAALWLLYSIILPGPMQWEGLIARGLLWQLLLPIWVVLLAAMIRYADPVVAAISLGTYLGIVATFTLQFTLGKALLPFVLMLAAGGSYYTVKRLSHRPDAFYYHTSLQTAKALSLACFYLAGNYLIVREGNALLNNLPVSTQISFAPLFYFLTAAIPLLYLYTGLRSADRIFLHTGLLAVAFSLYTLRFYRQVLPMETALTLAGAALVLLSGWALRYLRPARHGLTSEPADSPAFIHLNLEALATAHLTENSLKVPERGFQFGGGSSGGGGAVGEY